MVLFKYFILNIIIEVIVCLVMGYRTRQNILAAISVNMFTHPIILGIVVVLFRGTLGIGWVLLLECLVVLTEWQLFQYMFNEKNLKYLRLAFFMNAISYLYGVLFL